MKCPFCRKETASKVIDSRPTSNGFVTRRRRQCLECSKRYTTYERIERSHLWVIKKDESREGFGRNKILDGLKIACKKRPVSIEMIEAITDSIEQKIYETFDREVPSRYIGELVMSRLKKLDKIAYVRFASVYHEFQDITDFEKEVERVK